MPRKRKSKETTTDTETAAATATIEAQPDTSVEPQADTSVAPEPAPIVEQTPTDQTPSFVERLGERISRAVTPDPYTIALDNAAGVRLFESRRDRVMAIRFDEKPAQPVIDRIKEEGYRWNATDRVWTHAVQSDSAMSTRIDAERLYQEVRQMIRHDKGIDANQDIPF
jgi:hypothetical protein